ncbi:MAG: pyruvate carboxylase subunit B [Firmicutes bacterium]|nr:pyruvate carboxylase subunit B [Bacillota bacterium]
MSKMNGHGVGVTDTTLRDAHQSLWATRMRTADLVPILEKLDLVGYHSLEVWGGATFDVCLRYLEEDPWERLRVIRQHVERTPLQMLLRGQNLVGYKHYPDDIVERFINKAVANGIQILRIFDALNDVDNLRFPIEAARRAGAHVQATVVYTVSPVHTLELYVDMALNLQELGADSICIKDMAGLLQPYVAYELVESLKSCLDIPVQLHSHYIGGHAMMSYLKAIEAGVDAVDTATAPLAFGSSQPAVETLAGSLRGTLYDPKLDMEPLFEIAEYFDGVRRHHGWERGVTRITDMQVFSHQVPGGMISNLVSQLQQQKAIHRLPEVLAEIPRVREELGYPPLVTPTSQIVGIQAVLNVLTGARYKVIPEEVRLYARGFYGKPPVPIYGPLKALLVSGADSIDCRPADLLESGWERAKLEIGDLAHSEEDILSYALFPEVGRKFLEERKKAASITSVHWEAAVAGSKSVPEQSDSVDIQAGAGSRKTDEKSAATNASGGLEDIKEVLAAFSNTSLQELNLETGEYRLKVRK